MHNGEQFIEDSPKPITHYGLPDYLQEVDAVQTWRRNGDLFIILSKSCSKVSPFQVKLISTGETGSGGTTKLLKPWMRVIPCIWRGGGAYQRI